MDSIHCTEKLIEVRVRVLTEILNHTPLHCTRRGGSDLQR